MILGITLAFVAMRAGLKLRRARTQGGRRTRTMRDAHLRLAKPAVIVVAVGFLGGIVSAYFLRGWTPFENFHGWLGLAVAGLFVAAAVVGHRIAVTGQPVFVIGVNNDVHTDSDPAVPQRDQVLHGLSTGAAGLAIDTG